MIQADLWKQEENVSLRYFTVHVYKHTGMGNEATVTNVVATNELNATLQVQNVMPWLRTNPMYAFEQKERG